MYKRHDIAGIIDLKNKNSYLTNYTLLAGILLYFLLYLFSETKHM